MKTILFLTVAQAEQYAADNRLQETNTTTSVFDNSADLEYFDHEDFRAVVGAWSGEVSAYIYTDGDEEIALAWWYNPGEGPTVDLDGTEVTDQSIIGGVYATNGDPTEIDADAAQCILIECKRNGVEVLTSEDEGGYEDAIEKLDFGSSMPDRVYVVGEYIFALPG